MKWKVPKKRKPADRKLEDLISVGPAIRRDLELLGIRTVTQLSQQDPETLYRNLCAKTGVKQDVCVLDVYRAAVAQAKNPELPAEQCDWWYWSRKRKAAAKEDSPGLRHRVHL
jgi:hypothetical protein